MIAQDSLSQLLVIPAAHVRVQVVREHRDVGRIGKDYLRLGTGSKISFPYGMSIYGQGDGRSAAGDQLVAANGGQGNAIKNP